MNIPKPTIERLPLYMRCLARLRDSGVEVVSSEELGRLLAITSVQIRKDLAYFGEFGRRGVGYDVEELLNQITSILGADRPRKLALIGAGHLGQALANYDGFREQGFNITAVFDSDRSKVGGALAGQTIMHTEQMAQVLGKSEIELAIVAVPGPAAQKVADVLVQAGIKAIWNFAPIRLEVPHTVEVRQENLIVGLMALSYHLAQEGKG
jgi:redox-sensing transcriptional repressor